MTTRETVIAVPEAFAIDAGHANTFRQAARYMDAKAREHEEAAAGHLNGFLPCPDWCTADQHEDWITRSAHQWNYHDGGATRAHVGVLNTWVVEQWELLDVDGTHRLATINRLRRALKGRAVETADVR